MLFVIFLFYIPLLSSRFEKCTVFLQWTTAAPASSPPKPPRPTPRRPTVVASGPRSTAPAGTALSNSSEVASGPCQPWRAATRAVAPTLRDRLPLLCPMMGIDSRQWLGQAVMAASADGLKVSLLQPFGPVFLWRSRSGLR